MCISSVVLSQGDRKCRTLKQTKENDNQKCWEVMVNDHLT